MKQLKTLGLAVIGALALSAVAIETTGRSFTLGSNTTTTTQNQLEAGTSIDAVLDRFPSSTPINTITGSSNDERKLIYEVGTRDKSLT